MKTKKVLKFSKETMVILDNKSKKTIIGGDQQQKGTIRSCGVPCTIY